MKNKIYRECYVLYKEINMRSIDYNNDYPDTLEFVIADDTLEDIDFLEDYYFEYYDDRSHDIQD
jgi:hypothetical protein